MDKSLGYAKVRPVGDQVRVRWPGLAVLLTTDEARRLADELDKAALIAEGRYDYSGVDPDQAAFGGVWGQ